MPETSDSEYNRGHAAGGIEERLAQHDRHFEQINGSISRVAVAMEKVFLELTRDGGAA